MPRRDPFNFHRLRALVMVTFGFSRSEARAFLILLPLMFIIVFIQPVYQTLFESGKPDNFFADARELDSLLATLKWETDSAQTKKDYRKNFTLFHFDPNSASVNEMDSLGIPNYIGQRIERYRIKGGRFKIKSDLQRIYGFDSTLFNSLEPFIDLPSRMEPAPKHEGAVAQLPEKINRSSSNVVHTATKTKEIFDLNVVDTVALDKLYGIGPALARRIVAYRERLGGFIQEEQLFEVWGLDSAIAINTLERVQIAEGFVPKRININTANEKELAGHPYMKPKMARQIVTYRFQHGNFSSIEDLGKIYSFEPKTFDRIKPYLTLE